MNHVSIAASLGAFRSCSWRVRLRFDWTSIAERYQARRWDVLSPRKWSWYVSKGVGCDVDPRKVKPPLGWRPYCIRLSSNWRRRLPSCSSISQYLLLEFKLDIFCGKIFLLFSGSRIGAAVFMAYVYYLKSRIFYFQVYELWKHIDQRADKSFLGF